MLKQYFVKQALKEAQIEKFIRQHFPEGNYSHMDLQRTPLGIKIIIYSSTPGKIIGRGGRIINEMTDALKAKFKLENPQLDVKPILNPDLNPRIVAKHIATALERGFNFKRIGNLLLKRVMRAGAIGVEIKISGRVLGGKAMRAKFIDGYLKHSGEPAKTLVDYGFEEIYRIGKSKPGKVGIKVKIMKEFQTITGERKSSMKDLQPKRADEAVQPAEKEKPKAGKDKAPKKEGKPKEEKKGTVKAAKKEKKPSEEKKGKKEAAKGKPQKPAKGPEKREEKA